MHITIALLKSGQHVVSVDLDHEQRTLTRYIENRRDSAESHHSPLQLPDHVCIDDLNQGRIKWNDGDRISALSDFVRSYDNSCDFVLIDTAGSASTLNVFAHGLADTLVTPVNDSFLDLDVIFSMGPTPDRILKPSRYTQTVTKAFDARRSIGQREPDWVVVRNRISPLASRNERGIVQALDTLAQRGTFRLASGLVERVVYREFFPLGLTTFDSFETSRLGVKPSMSHVLARLEVRQLITTLNLPLNPTGLVPDDCYGQDSKPVDGDLRQLLIPVAMRGGNDGAAPRR
jgi:chromosome partitioning protein